MDLKPPIEEVPPTAHTIASHSDTTATGAELEELTDGSNTTLHGHVGITTNAANIVTNVTAIGLNTTHRGLTAGNPHSVTPTELGLIIGTNVLAQQTIGIADNNLLEVDNADAADNDYAKFTANGLEGRDYTEVLSDLGETSRTINLLQSDNTAAKQAKIDAVGKYIPYDVDIMFQFEIGGTHTEIAQLDFLGFFGGGRLYIQGNTGEANATDLHTTQDTIIDITAQTGIRAFYISCCAIRLFVQNFKIMLSDTTGSRGIHVNNNTYLPYVRYNYIYAAGVVNDTRGIEFHECGSGRARENYVSTLKYGIQCRNSRILSQINDDTGIQPLYGLYAEHASIIGKQSTQPSGSTANELVADGSIIR